MDTEQDIDDFSLLLMPIDIGSFFFEVFENV